MEEKTVFFVQCKEFRVKNYFVPPVEDNDINSFCWKLRDDIDRFIDTSFISRQNVSNKEIGALKKLKNEKNKVICIDDTDKNLGAATADKSDVTKACRRQLYNQSMYFKLSEDAKN